MWTAVSSGSIVRFADSWSFFGVGEEMSGAESGIWLSATSEGALGVSGAVFGEDLGFEVVFRMPEGDLLAFKAEDMVSFLVVVAEEATVRGGRVRRVGAIMGQRKKKRNVGRRKDTASWLCRSCGSERVMGKMKVQ